MSVRRREQSLNQINHLGSDSEICENVHRENWWFELKVTKEPLPRVVSLMERRDVWDQWFSPWTLVLQVIYKLWLSVKKKSNFHVTKTRCCACVFWSVRWFLPKFPDRDLGLCVPWAKISDFLQGLWCGRLCHSKIKLWTASKDTADLRWSTFYEPSLL